MKSTSRRLGLDQSFTAVGGTRDSLVTDSTAGRCKSYTCQPGQPHLTPTPTPASLPRRTPARTEAKISLTWMPSRSKQKMPDLHRSSMSTTPRGCPSLLLQQTYSEVDSSVLAEKKFSLHHTGICKAASMKAGQSSVCRRFMQSLW